MNPNAAALLDAAGLPRTKDLPLRVAAEGDRKKKYYLRMRTGSSRRSRRCSATYIKNNLDHLEVMMELGDLVACEHSYEPVIGGASLVRPGFVYSEFVQGHSVTMLRRGCCGARLLTIGATRVRFTTIQKWTALQRGNYIYSPLAVCDESLCERTVPLLDCIGTQLTDAVLEWFWTKDGLYFCDVHELENAEFGKNLPELSHSKTVSVMQCSKSTGNIFVDALDFETQHAASPGDTYICVNGALLSHFLTKAAQAGDCNVYLFNSGTKIQ